MGIENFGHETCHARHAPACTIDPSHGHSVTFVGAEVIDRASQESKGDRVAFLCKQCAAAHMSHRMLGPLAVIAFGPDPLEGDRLFEIGIVPDDAEKMILDALAANEGDEFLTEFIDEFRTTRALAEAQRAAAADVEIVQPMNATDFGRLMAASPKTSFPKQEEIN